MDKVWLVVFTIFLLGLSLRAIDLGTGLTTDEVHWLSRSPSFIDAILLHQWDETYKAPHPGVVIMWLSGISIKAYQGSDFPTKLSFARAPTVLITSLLIIFIFYFLNILFNTKIALLSATLVALDPFFLAHSRLIHLDAMLTTFMLLCLFSLMAFLKQRKTKLLLMVGVFLGLAMLTKLPALFLLIFIPAVVFFASNDTKIKSIKYIFFIIIVAVSIFFLVWPSMWVSPVDTFMKILFDQNSGLEVAVTSPHGSGFFLGKINDGNYGPLFYPVSFLMMATPITLLFFLIFLAILIKNIYNNGFGGINKNMIILFFYVTLFIAQMALSLKAFPRYILPVFPAVDIMSAIGIYYFFERYITKKFVFYSLMACIILIQISLIMPISPYFLSYSNPAVFGGPSHAPDMILMGWGEGNDLAANYLNKKQDARNLTVAFDYRGFEQYFVGKALPLDQSMNFTKSIDYIVFYISSVQREWNKNVWKFYKNKTPEKVIKLNGIDYCLIYKASKLPMST